MLEQPIGPAFLSPRAAAERRADARLYAAEMARNYSTSSDPLTSASASATLLQDSSVTNQAKENNDGRSE